MPVKTTAAAMLALVHADFAEAEGAPCCFNRWGTSEQCGHYPHGSSGGRCQNNWEKHCKSPAACRPPPPPSPPTPPTPSAYTCDASLSDYVDDVQASARRRRRRSANTTMAPTTAAPTTGPKQVDGPCDSAQQPRNSCCSGCPPMKDGKLCASTSRFHDQTKGPCGCGEEPPPKDHWMLTNYTAALNAKSLDPKHPSSTWCPSGCGGCYELCSTGGWTDGLPRHVDAGKCVVFRVSNRCGDGYDPSHIYPEWCSNSMTWQECQEEPGKCTKAGSTNKFGYPAHFDLMNLHHQIEHLGWKNNVEVTFEPVSCDRFDGPKWDCDCKASEAPGIQPPSTVV